MQLNIDFLKQSSQCFDNQNNDSAIKNQTKVIIEEVEQYLPDEIIESENQQQEKGPLQASIVIPAFGGFFTDDAIDFKQVQAQKNNLIRLTIYSRLTLNIQDNQTSGEALHLDISVFIAWAILIYQTINNAIIPAWIMTVAFDKYLRIVWRFFIQTIFLIPFIMHEHRTGNLDIKKQYQLNYIGKNIKRLYLASIIPSVFTTIFLFCFEYTYISTVFLLGQQTNFWLSILRNKHQNHKIEKTGKLIWMTGLICIIQNLYYLESHSIPQFAENYINRFIYLKSAMKRIFIGTTLPLFSSFLSARLSFLNIQAREIFPLHLTNFSISLFTCLNILIVSYFIDGTQFNNQKFFGLFGLFYDSRIIMFTYIAIVIIIGMYLCSMLTCKLFDQFTLLLFNMMEPILTSILLKQTGVQYYPDIEQYLGYLLLQGGQLIIIIGQKQLQNSSQRNSVVQQK